jgi:transposase, IS30 family
MRPGRRFGLSAEQKLDVWRRWKAGQTLHEIGRAFGKDHNSIRGVVARHGGIVPAVRRRALLALTLREREEISRGLASGSSFRAIAKCLERAVSTVSREVAPAWWPSGVSSQSGGRRSLAVGLAAQALPSFHPPEVARHRCE